MAKRQGHPELKRSPLVEGLPKACADELVAVEFMERQRWGSNPVCVHCGSDQVYKMADAATGERSKRFLWRCRSCQKQYTVRVGTVFEESRIGLHHWCYAFWRAASSKKGVSAREIQRHCQLSYKSALFMLHRIRFALQVDYAPEEKLNGIVEVDETYIGGRPKNMHQAKKSMRGHRDHKIPVLAMLERGGRVRAQHLDKVTAENAKKVLKELVDSRARIMTDESHIYDWTDSHFRPNGHDTVNHGRKEYVRGDITTNTIEGFFSILKRGIFGVYHSVSRRHLHRYLSEFEFRYNNRAMNDGDRIVLAIQQAEGKRLMYKTSIVLTDK